jgi:hypothetical protein
MQAAAAILPRITAKALGKHGFAVAGIITDWPQIVGESLAAETMPQKIAFPPGRRSGGTLYLRASSPMATELQHLEPQIVERINGYFGYGAVARLSLHHGPVARRERPPAPDRVRPLAPAAAAALTERLRAIDDEELRDAFERLGRAVYGRRQVG